MATDIAPFSLSVEESKLELLRKKLELTTFPDEVIQDAITLYITLN
jgi:hypothetical protein